MGYYMILLTGGAGFIGSHTALSLLEQNFELVIVDNFYNSNTSILDKIQEISQKRIHFYELDCCDENAMERVFQKHSITAAIHFAGYKAVGESSQIPLEYYDNNIKSTLILLKLLKKYNVKKIIFSSSATVYGAPKKTPITEDFPLHVTNPYGRCKLMIEDMLRDVYKAEPEWSIGILRYFNPIGAHKTGLIGEKTNGIPNNLMPYLSMVASGKLPFLPVFGNDYPTKDGTGVRDYIHIMDLANGHCAMLKKTFTHNGIFTYNLGTGQGYSVLELIRNFEKITKINIPYQIKERRSGDIAACFANPKKAEIELGWCAQYNLQDMIEDSWRFEQNNNVI